MAPCRVCDKLKLNGCVAIVPSEICIRIVKGTDNIFEFVLLDGKGEAVDIRVDDVTLTVKDYVGGTTKISKSNLHGTHLDGENGRTLFTIAGSDITDTSNDVLYWVYEVRRTQPLGQEHVHLTGPFIIDAPV